MPEKEFRKLGRSELVEIIYQLQKERESLQMELKTVKEQLATKELKISKAGSIAEAVVGLNDIFKIAQDTADQYLKQIKAANDETEMKCINMLKDAQSKSEEMLKNAQEQSSSILEQTDKDIAAKQEALEKSAQAFLTAHSEFGSLLNSFKTKTDRHEK